MPKFRVKGCFKENAEDVEVIIEATSYKEAERSANKMGILVSDVLAVTDGNMKKYVIRGLDESSRKVKIEIEAEELEEAVLTSKNLCASVHSVELLDKDEISKQPSLEGEDSLGCGCSPFSQLFKRNIRKTNKERVQTIETDYFGNGRLWAMWVLACIPCINFWVLAISAQVFIATKSSVVKKQAAQVFGLSLITVVLLLIVGSLQETPTSKPKSNNTSNYSPSYSNYNSTKKWYEGGTLHSVPVTTWRTGSYRNKLATSADWCAIVDSTVSFETLKKRASQVLYCVEDAVSGGDADHMQISEIATACIIVLRENW